MDKRGRTSISISILVVALILLYWYKKRPQRKAVECADLWENIKSSSARNIFFNALALAENDSDVQANLIQQSANKGWNIHYTNCQYALKYLKSHTNDNYPVGSIAPEQVVVTEDQLKQIDDCICGKYLVKDY
jgi:hypothetical protein